MVIIGRCDRCAWHAFRGGGRPPATNAAAWDRVLTVQREVSSGGEPDDVGGVEVEHLRAGESAVADVAEAEDGVSSRRPSWPTARWYHSTTTFSLSVSTTRGCADRAASGWTSPRSSSRQPSGAKSFPASGRCPRRQRRRCRRRGTFVGVAPQTSPGGRRVAGRPARRPRRVSRVSASASWPAVAAGPRR